MISGWINSIEPVRTKVQHRESGCGGGSTLQNLLKALSSSCRGNKDHRIISHEFGVVSNHSTAQGTRPAVELYRSSGWFNPTEPLSSRGIKDHRIISHEFGVDQLFQTCSNQSTTQGTSPAVEFDMSSCRFNATLPNLLDPLSSRGNKDHKVFSYEFGVVQLFRTSSNHSTTQGTRPSVEFDTSSRNDPCWTVSSDFRWFASAEPTRTTAASMQGIIPPAQFPLSSGCIWFDSSESTRTTSATKKSSLPDHFPWSAYAERTQTTATTEE